MAERPASRERGLDADLSTGSAATPQRVPFLSSRFFTSSSAFPSSTCFASWTSSWRTVFRDLRAYLVMVHRAARGEPQAPRKLLNRLRGDFWTAALFPPPAPLPLRQRFPPLRPSPRGLRRGEPFLGLADLLRHGAPCGTTGTAGSTKTSQPPPSRQRFPPPRPLAAAF